MRVSIVAGVLGMLLAAVGCGSTDSNGAGNRDQFISQLCMEFASCCTAAGRPGDGAQCRAFYGAFIPGLRFDSAKADACLKEVRALGDSKCDSISSGPTSCRQVFTSNGNAKPGEACESETDCAPSAEGAVRCANGFIGDAQVAQCQVQLTGVEGSTPCVGTVSGNITSYSGSADTIPSQGYLCDDADGLTCDEQSGACRALRAVGEDCKLSPCISSAYCDFMDNVCKDRLALGAACQDDDACVATAYCQPSDSTCAARHAVGEACATNTECLFGNCTNQECGPSGDLSIVLLCGSN